jgi:hypothetical protein
MFDDLAFDGDILDHVQQARFTRPVRSDDDGRTARRRTVRKTATRTTGAAKIRVTDPNQKRVMTYLTRNGQSHEDTIADHIAAQVGGQVDTESIVHGALLALQRARLVVRVSPGVWKLS